MKNIKKLFILFLIVLLTGCSGAYNINIDANQRVTENVNFNIDKRAGLYEKAIDLMESYGLSKDDYDITETDNSIKINYTKTYINIDDYLVNSILYRELFNEINYINNSEEITFSASSKLLMNPDIKSENIVNNFSTDYLSVNLTTDNEMISSNADEVNEGTYTWKFDKETTSKTISFSLSPNNSSSSKLYIFVLAAVIIIIVGSLIIVGRNFASRQKMN